MNTNKHKLCYKFMVHDNEEFEKIYSLIKRRKFAILEYSEEYKGWFWIEFPNELINPKNMDFDDSYRYIRVYFINQHNIDKFKKMLKRRMRPITCGNDNCSRNWCEYHWDKYKPGNRVEYLWRCILEVDYNFTPYVFREVQNGTRA